MDWKNQADEYLGSYQLGINGKYIGISRMMKTEDVAILSTKKVVANIRPRGVLSGFLVIVPNLGHAVFLPPTASKIRPSIIRMRCSKFLLENGAIFSAYVTKDNTYVIEDIIIWNNTNVWATLPFEERWNKIMNDCVKSHILHDSFLHSNIELAKYVPLEKLEMCSENAVMEFVPNEARQKRLIFIVAKDSPVVQECTVVAKKDINTGPDVYTLWRSGEKLGYGLVRTMAMSKALRNMTVEEISVKIEWNKQFNKWEIIEVIST